MNARIETAWRIWRVALAATATVCAIDIPARLVLTPHSTVPVSETLSTLLFSADVVLRLLLARKKHKAALRQSADTAALESYPVAWLLADVIAAIPFGPLCGIELLSLLRLLKLSRVAQWMGQRRHRAVDSPLALQLTFFVYWVVLCTHWISCGWILLREPLALPPLGAYLQALYWTVQTFSTVGYGDVTPTNAAQTAYAVLVMIFGVGVYGYVIGNVAGILTRVDPVKARRRETMETLAAFMHYRGIPRDLRRRINDHYTYLWEKRLAFDESSLIAALPPSLQTEVALFLKRDIVERVPLFAGADDAFIREIALQMNPTVFLPGDTIYNEGSTSRNMYFITRGQLEVVTRARGPVATLEEGDFFGEMGLVLGQRRAATVRAVTHCDLYCLDRELFERVLAHHPGIADQLSTEANRRRAALDAAPEQPQT